MSEEQCFCHLGKYQVKDATARKDIADLRRELDYTNNRAGDQLELINALRKDVDLLNAQNVSVIGTWRLNNYLTIPSEMIGKVYNVGFSISHPEEGALRFNYFVFYDVGCITYDGEQTLDDAYSDGWSVVQAKTITIFEDPTDPIFKSWLLANATIQTENDAPRFYIVASQEDLPENAPEGSIARFPDHSNLSGCWDMPGDNQLNFDMFTDGFTSVLLSCPCIIHGNEELYGKVFSGIRVGVDNERHYRLTLYYGNQSLELYSSRDGWLYLINTIEMVENFMFWDYDIAQNPDAPTQFMEFIQHNFIRDNTPYLEAIRVDGSWEI